MPKLKKSWFSIVCKDGAPPVVKIFDEIGGWGVSAADFQKDLLALGEVDEIELLVHSPGGAIFEGYAIYNMLKSHPAKITAYVEGLAASIASFVVMAADEIRIPRNAYIMIHDATGGAYGKSEDLRKRADLMDQLQTTIVNEYMTRATLTEEEVVELMTAETWFDGAAAVEAGFADVLTDPIETNNCFDAKNQADFKNAPENINQYFNTVPAAGGADNPKAKKEKVKPMPQTEEMKAAAAKKFRAAETTRRSDIRAAFGAFSGDHADLLNASLDDMDCTVETARANLLNALGSKAPAPADKTVIVTGYNDAGDKNFINNVSQALAFRAGVSTDKDAGPLRGYTLTEIARMSLERHGVKTAHLDKMTLIANAFTHSSGDFAAVLGNTANKAMLKGWDETEENFQLFCSDGELSDFKIVDRVDLGAFPSLRQVRPGAEYKSITVGDRSEQVQLATYGELFGITRQAIINDDLGVFTQIPRKMGRAALRTIGDLVFAVLNSNAAMKDGKALFHADHANLLGASGINTAGLDAARVAMAEQKDGDATLNIMPKHLLVPTALQTAAIVAMESEFEVGASTKNNTTPNGVRNMVKSIVSDARLAANAWYLLADQGMHDTIEVQWLDGNKTPTLEQQNGWNIDGVEFKVRIDAGVKALDSKTMTKTPTA